MSENSMQNRPRVLIVDNEERAINLYKKLLHIWDYSVIVAEGNGAELLADAKAKAEKFRCQIAIVDMRLVDNFDEDDTSGLDLIDKLKPAATIIVSGYGTVQLAVEIVQKRGAASFFEKNDDPANLKESIDSLAQRICAARRSINIEPVGIIDLAKKTLFDTTFDSSSTAEYHDQIYDALVQLFPDAKTLRLEKVNASNISSEYSTVPRPRSVILRVFADGLQPVIVKLARRVKISREVKRFNEYVRGRLVGNYNPVLEKDVELWDIGGLKLSYVGKIEENFANFYSVRPIEKIKESLEHFFTETWSAHYSQAVDRYNVSLFKLYCDVWDRDWVKRANTYTLPVPPNAVHPISWMEIPTLNPLEWLKTITENEGSEKDPSVFASTQVAVTHGDLHADNLLIDDSQHGWVIDFERTGEGHALQDFVELESDIVTRFACTGEAFSSFYYFCLVIASGNSIDEIPFNHAALTHAETQKLLATIASIRTLAVRCTAITDMRQYLLGLYFNTIFRATIISREQHQQSEMRAWMLASILCYRLAHWDEPWPPKEWENLAQ